MTFGQGVHELWSDIQTERQTEKTTEYSATQKCLQSQILLLKDCLKTLNDGGGKKCYFKDLRFLLFFIFCRRCLKRMQLSHQSFCIEWGVQILGLTGQICWLKYASVWKMRLVPTAFGCPNQCFWRLIFLSMTSLAQFYDLGKKNFKYTVDF